MNNVNYLTTGWEGGVKATCQELGLKEPRKELMLLPMRDDGSVGNIKSASVILLSPNNEILMVQEKWKRDALALPGGGRALNESKWDSFTEVQIRHEKFFPLLTAAREASEECPWLFKTTKVAYNLLNSPKTSASKNTGWKTFPVVTYLRELPEDMVSLAKNASADNSNIDVRTKEISGVAMVRFADLEAAWNKLGWTAEKLAERQRRIGQASPEKKSDLSDLPFEQDLTVQVGSKEFLVKSYAARSIFSNIKHIRRTHSQKSTVY